MLPFNSVFHIKSPLSPLFLKKTNAFGATPLSAPTVCHREKALLPFVLVKLEEPCHKSKTLGVFFSTAGFVGLWCRKNVHTGTSGDF